MKWKIISQRSYKAEGDELIEPWPYEGTIDQHKLKVELGLGRMATKRVVVANMVMEYLMYQEGNSA